jgi:hypothetical protein
MDTPELYPPIEMLPVEPLRLKICQTWRRVAAISFYGFLLGLSVVYGLSVFVFHVPMRRPLPVFLILMAVFGLPYFLLPLTKWNVEISGEGLRNVGPFRTGELFRWEDFRQRHVTEGFGRCSFRLTDQTANPPRSGFLTVVDINDECDEWLSGLIRSVWVRPDPLTPPEFVFTRFYSFKEQLLIIASHRGLSVLEGKNDTLDGLYKDLRTLSKELVKVQVDQDILNIHEESISADSGTDKIEGSIKDVDARRKEVLERFESIADELQASHVAWHEVESINVWVTEHDRSDFAQLTIRLPERELEWHVTTPGSNRERNFGGSTSEELTTMFRQNVPADRFVTTAYHGEPQTLDEWERRYDDLVERPNRDQRDTVRVARIWLPALAALLVLAGGAIELVAMLIFFGPILAGMWYFKRRDLRALEIQYAEWRQLFPPDQSEHQIQSEVNL